MHMCKYFWKLHRKESEHHKAVNNISINHFQNISSHQPKWMICTWLIFFLTSCWDAIHSAIRCCSKHPLKKTASSMLLVCTVCIKTAKNWTMRFHWPPHAQSERKVKINGTPMINLWILLNSIINNMKWPIHSQFLQVSLMVNKGNLQSYKNNMPKKIHILSLLQK